MSLFLKVGELANRTGITVRTLHHYDEIGLLTPSHHSGAGHRLYTEDDIKRLQQIVSLKQIGLSLSEIKDCIEDEEFSMQGCIEKHIQHLERTIENQTKLLDSLLHIHTRLNRAEDISNEDWMNCIQEVVMFEKYYTKEQLQELEERGKEVGQERIEQVQEEWKELIANVKKAKAQGLDPTKEPMLGYARKWQALIDEFTGGNKEIEKSLANLYKNEPQVYEQRGYDMDPELMGYVGQAIASLK